jgi:hypothetical protein
VAIASLQPEVQALISALAPFVGLGAAQARELQKIDAKLEALVTSPLRAASEYLKDAAVETDEVVRRDYLERARHKLSDALGNAADVRPAALIAATRLAAVDAVLGRTSVARRRFEESQILCDQMIGDLLVRVNDTAVVRPRRPTGWALAGVFTMYYLMALPFRKVYRVWRAERALPRLVRHLEVERQIRFAVEELGGDTVTEYRLVEDCPETGGLRLSTFKLERRLLAPPAASDSTQPGS